MNTKIYSEESFPHITIWSLLQQFIWGKRLIAITFCLVITSCITFLRPLVIKGITDEGMLKANMTMITTYALFLLLCIVIEQAINIIQSRQFAVIQNAIMLSLYQTVYDKVLKLKKGYFTDHNSADIINRTTMDVRAVSMIADRSILFIASYVLAIVGGMLGLFMLNWKLAILVVAVVPFKGMIAIYMAKVNERTTEDNIRLNRKFFSWFLVMLSVALKRLDYGTCMQKKGNYYLNNKVRY